MIKKPFQNKAYFGIDCFWVYVLRYLTSQAEMSEFFVYQFSNESLMMRAKVDYIGKKPQVL